MHDHYISNFIDALSIGTVLATLAGLLPSLATLASLIWACIRIYETRTVQSWLKKGKENV